MTEAVREVVKDETLHLGRRKFHYKDESYDKPGKLAKDYEGTVTLKELDETGKENGLFIRDFYYKPEDVCSARGYTEIGHMKDGKLDGPVYGFYDGQLMKIKIDDKVIMSGNEKFKLYEKTAPDFEETFKMLKNAKTVVDRRESWVYRNLEKFQDKIFNR